ncbi:MAG: phenylalanine--tRNA ligase subunit alpha [Candidatus Babeliales bacterium]
MHTLEPAITTVKNEFLAHLEKATTQQQLEEVRLIFLARNGRIADLMTQLKELSLEEKKSLGPQLNTLKTFCTDAFDNKKKSLILADLHEQQRKQEYFDVSAYKPQQARGSLHPLTTVQQEVNDIFSSMGFSLAEGPEVETERRNFEALNIPKNHPARDMWDTFWLDVPGLLLRTHTSSVQVHSMEKEKGPLAVVAPGRCFRHEATDASHDFMFSQVEGLVIDEHISMSNLMATVKTFFQALFEQKKLKIRVRPSYFPFVEPGIEIDIECPFCNHGCSVCKQSEWIEICGAGLMHPNVLEFCGIDTKRYSGFAFGFGLTRVAMLKYGISDIRLLHSGNLEFLKQF